MPWLQLIVITVVALLVYHLSEGLDVVTWWDSCGPSDARARES